MLNVNKLKKQIQDAIEETMPNAVYSAQLEMMGTESESYKESAKKVADKVTELFAEPFATRLSEAIDAYVKNIQLYGTVITTGSPFTQTGIIQSTPIPTTNGVVPNTLGIQ